MMLTRWQDHILTENIWFVWSETSYSGNERMCHGCGTNERTNSEDRATQPMEAGGWVSQFLHGTAQHYMVFLGFCIAWYNLVLLGNVLETLAALFSCTWVASRGVGHGKGVGLQDKVGRRWRSSSKRLNHERWLLLKSRPLQCACPLPSSWCYSSDEKCGR